jgi:hypothetical protein
MATAENKVTKEMKMVEVNSSVVVLTLSLEEAQVIRDILGTVIGCPTTSRRKLTTQIYEVLGYAGIPFRSDYPGDLTGNPRFI